MYCSNMKVSKERFIDAVMASASIPIVIEDQNYKVDGGVRNNVPLGKAVMDGCTKIYVILCRPCFTQSEPWEPSKHLPRALDIGLRSLDDIMTHRVMVSDVSNLLLHNSQALERGDNGIEVHLYAPDRVWMGMIEFDPVKIKKAFKAGLVTEETNLEGAEWVR